MSFAIRTSLERAISGTLLILEALEPRVIALIGLLANAPAAVVVLILFFVSLK
jgi:hypothetical protein